MICIYISIASLLYMYYYINMQNDINKHIKPLRLKGLPADFRENIRKARTKRGWSQRKLGLQVGLPQPHISAIESGKIVPRFDTLLDMVRVLYLDFLLVPRSLVPAVQSLIRTQRNPESVERPIYADVDEEPASEKMEHNEF